MTRSRLFATLSVAAIASVLAGCAVYPAYPVGVRAGGYTAPYPAYRQSTPLLFMPQPGYYGNPYDGYSGGYGDYSGGYFGGYSGGYGGYFGGYGGAYPRNYYRHPGWNGHEHRDGDRHSHRDGDHKHSGPGSLQDALQSDSQQAQSGDHKGSGSRRDRD